jgi:hypothetical protein
VICVCLLQWIKSSGYRDTVTVKAWALQALLLMMADLMTEVLQLGCNLVLPGFLVLLCAVKVCLSSIVLE